MSCVAVVRHWLSPGQNVGVAAGVIVAAIPHHEVLAWNVFMIGLVHCHLCRHCGNVNANVEILNGVQVAFTYE